MKPVVAVVVASLLAYANVFWNHFTDWDDRWLIFENPHSHQLTWDGIKAIFNPWIDRQLLGAEFLPVRDLSWLMDHVFFGGNPVGFHIGDVFFHVLTSVALFFFFRELLGRSSERAAVLAALIFAVHPVHTESVTWMSSRKDVLSGVFVVFGAYLWIARVHGGGRRLFGGEAREESEFSLAAYLGVLFLYGLAILSKSTALSFPVLLVLLDLSLRRVSFRPAALGRWCLKILPFFGMTGLLMLVVRMTSGASGLRVTEYHGGSLLATLWIQSKAFFDYVLVLFFPVTLRTAVTVPKRFVLDFHHAVGCAFVLGLCVLSVVYVAALLRRRVLPQRDKEIVERGRFPLFHLSGFASSWFLICLLPMANLIPMNWVYCERYLYLPSIGFSLWGGVLLHRCLSRASGSPKKYALVVGGVVIVFLALTGRTLTRNRDWKDNLTLWTVTAAQAPSSPDVIYAYAKALENEGKAEEALAEFERVLVLNPGKVPARENLSNLLVQKGRREDLEAARLILTRGIALSPDAASLHNNLAVVHRLAGDRIESLRSHETAARLDRKYRSAYAESLYENGRFKTGMEVVEKALETSPRSLPVLRLAAKIALAMGDRGKARGYAERGLEIDPNRPGLKKILREAGGE